MNKLKKGDVVQIMKGKDAGKSGEIIQVIPAKQKVVVEKLNMIKKHVKPTQESKGGIIDIPAPISWSNVMLIDPTDKKVTRVKFDNSKKKKVRVTAKSGKALS